jgi:hypothetical protein
MNHWTRFILIAVCSVGAALTAHATDEPAATPNANPDPTLAGDQARAVKKAVKQSAKIAADATKEGAQQVADKARAVAHEVAVATQEGAEEVAATAKRGTEKTKAVLSDSKSTTDKPTDKPAAP